MIIGAERSRGVVAPRNEIAAEQRAVGDRDTTFNSSNTAVGPLLSVFSAESLSHFWSLTLLLTASVSLQ